MAAAIATSKASCHSRSISLPSRSHPLTASVEEHLCKLKASEATALCSPSSICHNLGVLSDLYEDLDNVLQMPLVQRALSHEQHGKWVEEVLDGSLGLFDVCSISKEALSLTKECVQELESYFRRRRVGESGHANEVQSFMIMRKKVNKMVHKCYGNFEENGKELQF